MKESFDQIKALNKSRIRPLVDNKKLIFSSIFEDALNFALDHYFKHKNTGYLVDIASLFAERNYQIFIIGFISERAGVKCSIKEGAIRMVRSEVGPNEKASLKVNLEKFASNGFKLEVKKPSNANTSKLAKDKKSPKKIDMLDSWARLPGSYGSGKRS